MKHIVGFSGGIDSQACALWVRNRFPAEDIVLMNSDAGGNEHPITTEFVEWYSDNVFPVVMIRPEVQDMGNRSKAKIAKLELQPTDPLTFDRLAEIKGFFPRRKMQFCTHHLKLMPQVRWIAENVTDTYERYAGLRRDESTNRKDTPMRLWDDDFRCWRNNPLADWTKEMCFSYVKNAGEKWNPLYDMGFSRVGCAPCVNSDKEDIRRWAAAFPEMIDKVRAWEQDKGFSFFGPIMPDGNSGRRWGWVDEVVEWSRTRHGGKQYELPILEAVMDEGLCQNQWGFCE